MENIGLTHLLIGMVINKSTVKTLDDAANESRKEMWKINEKVVRNQFNANKPIYFSHNPNDINIVGAGSFYEQEIELLKQLVQQKYGKTAKFNPSNQYWKLEW